MYIFCQIIFLSSLKLSCLYEYKEFHLSYAFGVTSLVSFFSCGHANTYSQLYTFTLEFIPLQGHYAKVQCPIHRPDTHTNYTRCASSQFMFSADGTIWMLWTWRFSLCLPFIYNPALEWKDEMAASCSLNSKLAVVPPHSTSRLD